MNNNNQSLLLGDNTITLSEAMQQIDKNSYGLLFLVDEDEKVFACISDGNIRRYLLSGGNMSDKAIGAANMNPKVAYSLQEAKRLQSHKGFTVIPILDSKGKVVEFYCGEGDRRPYAYEVLNVPVVINAGGKGSRLDPFTRVLPKPLIPIGELPIIEHIMHEFRAYSCNKFHIIVNYKRDLLKAYFNDNDSGYNITWHDEDKPLGTGGGLSLLKGKLNSTFFFVNCDVLLTTDYADLLQFHREHNNDITMVCAYKNIDIPYGVVDMGKDGIINSMEEKPVMSFLTNTGIYLCEPEVLDDMNDDEAIGFPDVVMREKKNGKHVVVYPISDNDWMDMGQLPELEKMRHKMYGE